MGKYDDLLADIRPAATVPAKAGKYDDLVFDIKKPAAAPSFSSTMADTAKNALLQAVQPLNPLKSSTYDAAIASAEPKNQKKLAPYAPAAMSTIGTAIAPGLGTALGAGAGDVLRQAINVANGEPTPTPLRAALEAGGATALGGILETNQAANALKSIAQNQGRRALGYTKRFFSKSPEQLPQANEVAQTMLDQGVIKPFSGAEPAINRAIDLGDKSGKQIGSIVDDIANTGKVAFDANDLNQEIGRQLNPGYSGGAYDKTNKIVDEIRNTVSAHGVPDVPKENAVAPFANAPYQDLRNPIDFKSLQALKKKLADIGKFVPNTNDERQQLFQRATGITRQAQDNAVEQVAPKSVADVYKKSKDLYGKSEQAIGALTNRISSEAGNNQLGLLDVILGAGHIASGNPAAALATLGFKKALDRLGAPTIAAMANGLAKSGMSRQAANATLQSILTNLEK